MTEPQFQHLSLNDQKYFVTETTSIFIELPNKRTPSIDQTQ